MALSLEGWSGPYVPQSCSTMKLNNSFPIISSGPEPGLARLCASPGFSARQILAAFFFFENPWHHQDRTFKIPTKLARVQRRRVRAGQPKRCDESQCPVIPTVIFSKFSMNSWSGVERISMNQVTLKQASRTQTAESEHLHNTAQLEIRASRLKHMSPKEAAICKSISARI